MNIGDFRICSAKSIRKFLLKRIDLRDNKEWFAYLAIYESRIFGLCFYRNLNRLSTTINGILKEASAFEQKVIHEREIDIASMLRKYQQIVFDN